MSRVFNMAVVGCGAIAQGMHLPNIAAHAGIRLRWCCDINPRTLKTVAARWKPDRTTTRIEDVAADPECDAVLIATHPEGRRDLVRTLAAAGKHLYVEKPLADNLPDILRIQRIADETGIVLSVGHNRRMAPALRDARDLFHAHRAAPRSEPWRWDREGRRRPPRPEERQTVMLQRINDDYFSWKAWAFEENAGILLLELNHFTDLAYFFLEREPVLVSAAGSPMMNVLINITFEDGSLCAIVDACVGTFGYPKELYEIYHQGAAIIVDHCMEVRTAGIPGQPFRRLYPSPGDAQAAGIEAWYDRTLEAAGRHTDKTKPLASPWPDKGHFRFLDAFVKACRGEGPNPCDAVCGARAAAIVLKAALSLRNGGKPQRIRPEEYLARPR